jgi:hypothetical protein
MNDHDTGASMIPRHWTTFAFRLLGIFIVISWISALPSALLSVVSQYLYGSEAPSVTLLLLGLIAIGIPLAVGIWLLTQTGWFVDRIYGRLLAEKEIEAGDAGGELSDEPAAYEPISSFGIDARDLQAIVLSLFGIWLLAYSIPDAINWMAVILNEGENPLKGMFNDLITGVRTAPLLTIAARLVIGLILFFRSYRIVDYWRTKMGLEEVVDEDSAEDRVDN